jgi:hypothetical protein
LKIDISIHPPINEFVALGVDQFEGAAARQQEQGDARDTYEHMAHNSAQKDD